MTTGQEMPSRASQSTPVSLTAFYLAQLSLGSFLKQETPKGMKQKMEERAARIETIKRLMAGGEPFSVRDICNVIGENKEVVRGTLEKMDKTGIVRRINHDKQVKWRLK
jgi:hypothetical protein